MDSRQETDQSYSENVETRYEIDQVDFCHIRRISLMFRSKYYRKRINQ